MPLSSVPNVPDCSSVTSDIGCATWCAESPLSAWQYMPACRQCTPQSFPNHTMPNATVPNATAACPGVCNVVQTSVETVLPRAISDKAPTAGCVHWCQWVSKPAWQYTPDCAACDAASVKPAGEILP